MRDVAAAVLERLTAEDAELVVYDGQPDETDPDSGETSTLPDRYVVFYLTSPRGEGQRASDHRPVSAWTLTTVARGRTPNEMRWVLERVHAALERTVLAVDGRRCGPIHLGSSAQPVAEDGIQPTVHVATDVWRFTTTQEA